MIPILLVFGVQLSAESWSELSKQLNNNKEVTQNHHYGGTLADPFQHEVVSAHSTTGNNPPTSKSAGAQSVSNNERSQHFKPLENNDQHYYYLHIPKAGGTTMQHVLHYNGVKVLRADLESLEIFGELTGTHPDRRVIMSKGNGFRENPPPHSFVMFREPVSHVISQYMHCRDWQRYRGRAGFPNTLLEWLEGWNNRLLLGQRKDPARLYKNTTLHSERMHDPKYKCFIPFNLQSWLTGADADTATKNRNTTKDFLYKRFDVVGVMSDMKKSACLFFVEILLRVPPFCDCTPKSTTISAHRALLNRAAWHGIDQHHAGSYNLTRKERALILKLTKQDRRLYHDATKLFQDQVAMVEEAYKVKLCGTGT